MTTCHLADGYDTYLRLTKFATPSGEDDALD